MKIAQILQLQFLTVKKIFALKFRYQFWNNQKCKKTITFYRGPGFGSADPCLWLLDSDPDPAIFITDLQGANKKLMTKKSFSAYNFLKEHLHNFSKIKVKKKLQNNRNIGFPDYFCLMKDGHGSGGPKTCGSGGSGSWIRNRIRKTGHKTRKHHLPGMHRLDAVNNLGPLNDHHWTKEKEHCCNPHPKDIKCCKN